MLRFPTGPRSSTIAAVALLASACTIGNSDRTIDDVVSTTPADDEFTLVDVAEFDFADAGWADHRTAELYLDNDDGAEYVTVASRGYPARFSARGEEARLWTVVVGESGREQTVVYARVVERGHIEVVAAQNDEGDACLMILERLPASLRAYRVHYAGPGEVSTERLGEWPLDPNVDWYGRAPLPMQSSTVAR